MTSYGIDMVFDLLYDIEHFRGPCRDSSMYRPRYKDINYRPRCKHFEFLSLESVMLESDRIGYLPCSYGIEGTVLNGDRTVGEYLDYACRHLNHSKFFLP